MIPSLHAGGGENLLANTCEIIPGNHIVICFSKPGILSKRIIDKGSIVFYPFRRYIDLIRTLKLIIDSLYSSKTIFQGWMYYGDLAAILLEIITFRKLRCRCYLITTANNINMSIGSRIARRICALASHISNFPIFAISESCLQSHVGIGYNAKSLSILTPPINAKSDISFLEILERRRLRRRAEQSIKLLMVARFDPVKNHALAFKAYEYFQGRFRLDLYGSGMNRANEQLKILINRCIPTASLDNLVLKGEVSNLISKLTNYDFILLTSLNEGLPLSIIEASQNAVLSIASNVGDVIKAASGEGLFYPSDNINILIDRINQAIELSAEDDKKKSSSRYSKMCDLIYKRSNQDWSNQVYKELFMSFNV